jgi:hypothetical protein
MLKEGCGGGKWSEWIKQGWIWQLFKVTQKVVQMWEVPNRDGWEDAENGLSQLKVKGWRRTINNREEITSRFLQDHKAKEEESKTVYLDALGTEFDVVSNGKELWMSP